MNECKHTGKPIYRDRLGVMLTSPKNAVFVRCRHCAELLSFGPSRDTTVVRMEISAASMALSRNRDFIIAGLKIPCMLGREQGKCMPCLVWDLALVIASHGDGT